MGKPVGPECHCGRVLQWVGGTGQGQGWVHHGTGRSWCANGAGWARPIQVDHMTGPIGLIICTG